MSKTTKNYQKLSNLKVKKIKSFNHPLYINLKQNKSKDEGWIRNEIPKAINKKKEKLK